jgi:hypothetical protein
MSQEGTRQGCVLGGILFAIALAPMLQALAALAPADSALFAMADDMRIAGSPQALAVMVEALPRLLHPLGLRLEPLKCVVLQPPGHQAMHYPVELQRFPIKLGIHSLGLPFAAGGMPDGHLPLGTQDFVEEELNKLGLSHNQLLDYFVVISVMGKPHEAPRLMQVVGIKRFQHLLRALPPLASARFAGQREREKSHYKECVFKDINQLSSHKVGGF